MKFIKRKILSWLWNWLVKSYLREHLFVIQNQRVISHKEITSLAVSNARYEYEVLDMAREIGVALWKEGKMKLERETDGRISADILRMKAKVWQELSTPKASKTQTL